jgi:hypothetical protein
MIFNKSCENDKQSYFHDDTLNLNIFSLFSCFKVWETNFPVTLVATFIFSHKKWKNEKNTKFYKTSFNILCKLLNVKTFFTLFCLEKCWKRTRTLAIVLFAQSIFFFKKYFQLFLFCFLNSSKKRFKDVICFLISCQCKFDIFKLIVN